MVIRRSRRFEGASRRGFLGGATSAVAGAVAARLGRESAQAAPRETEPLRVGLVGCGGRGTGAAINALKADGQVRLVAMGDIFADRLEASLERLQADETIRERVDVPSERRFLGFDAYQKVIAADLDVVLLATPPHFRPRHLSAAVEAGKHVFAEKPVAVDAPGVRSVLASCEEARRKNLSVVSGLCWRYDTAVRETIKRVHRGAIGDMNAIHIDDFRGPTWVKARRPEWNDMEYQLRNWYYFTWLSGDFNVEQHVHLLDQVAWALRGRYPATARGIGGRSWRTGPEFGNIYDHHAVSYEYADGLRLVSHCRQYPSSHKESTVHLLGTRGTAQIANKRTKIVTGRRTWEPSESNDKFQSEHDELFAAVRRGKPINDGDYMAKSTLMAIMGRMATYTGRVITWEEALSSTESLGPAQYAFGPLPASPVAVPGQEA